MNAAAFVHPRGCHDNSLACLLDPAHAQGQDQWGRRTGISMPSVSSSFPSSK